ncbi:MarR family transcriptional regulator [Streptomyces sp. NPDC057682]|uniref:MarR family transcriptional regulator n=1 Tax=Streptomyces sp. NPDC057682 TaxID=3346210 RepID=UPI0036CD60E0
MANPGYGKREAPGQLPRSAGDFALLPARERCVAGFVERLPEGASMSVKSLAKQIPLYGQQAIASALTALSVAGHLRRFRCSVSTGDGEVRWVFRTYWSRTARDNEWWAALAAGGVSETAAVPVPVAVSESASVGTVTAPVPAAAAVPVQRTAASAPVQVPVVPAAPSAPAVSVEPSPAFRALALLGERDARLALSEDDCAVLEPLAAQWLMRGVGTDYLVSVLTAGLPEAVASPRGFTRDRLVKKLPPARQALAPAGPAAPSPSMECTACRVPGPAEALPDGLCRSCRAPVPPESADPEECEVRTRVDGLRGLLRESRPPRPARR